MTDFLSFMSYIFQQLYQMLTSSRIASVLGYNLFVILVAFMIMWQVLNIFIFRSSILPGGISKVISKDNSSSSSSDESSGD